MLRGSVDLMITVFASTNDDLERVSVQILTSPHGPQNGASCCTTGMHTSLIGAMILISLFDLKVPRDFLA
jgi:hypothetical protein